MELGFKFEVCSECQFNCAHCAHKGLKSIDPYYHLSMEDLESFIKFTEESDYIASLAIHGPGEPLLWRHLTEGLARLRKSNSVKEIVIVSNGLLLPKVMHILDLVDSIRVSLYPESTTMIINHPKIIYNPRSDFYHKQYPASTPCTCLCDGPMIYRDLVFPHCGPPMFDAVRRVSPAQDPLSLGVKLSKNYLPSEKLSGFLHGCAYCWANSNCDQTVERHQISSNQD